MSSSAESVVSQSSYNDVLGIALIGFIFVLCILFLLSIAVWGIGLCFTRFVPAGKEPDVKEIEVPVVESAVWDDELEPHEIAVVAAAIHCIFGDKAHHIVSIRSSSSSWAQEGRRQIFTSRRVR